MLQGHTHFWQRWFGVWACAFLALFVPTFVGRLNGLAPYLGPVIMLCFPFLDRSQTEKTLGFVRPDRAGVATTSATLVVVLGLFWWGTTFFWGAWRTPQEGLAMRFFQEIAGIALVEEVFFRGWLQPAADRHLKRRDIRFLGQRLSFANLITSVAFAVLHLAAVPNVARLSVFFPSLWFGWLREKTGSIWPAILAHALSNLAMASTGIGR